MSVACDLSLNTFALSGHQRLVEELRCIPVYIKSPIGILEMNMLHLTYKSPTKRASPASRPWGRLPSEFKAVSCAADMFLPHPAALVWHVHTYMESPRKVHQRPRAAKHGGVTREVVF